ncbi:MAG: Rnase Y domain-containing protein, partial [Oscillospiraceae bacterium]
MNILLVILYCMIAFIASGVICGFIAFKLGVNYRKKIAEAEIGSAEEQAKKILNDAIRDADTKKKETIIEAKDELHKLRSDADREIKERRGELSRQERRIVQKEETLDKKMDNLESKDEQLQGKLRFAEEKLQEADTIKKSQIDNLERISGLTAEQAKDQLLDSLQDELTHEKAIKISNYEQVLKDECDEKAREYISLAIARCAADQVSEATVSVVNLPNDEM